MTHLLSSYKKQYLLLFLNESEKTGFCEKLNFINILTLTRSKRQSSEYFHIKFGGLMLQTVLKIISLFKLFRFVMNKS